MIYKQQDFLENLNNAVKYHDTDSFIDSLAPEVGALAHHNKPLLVKAIQKAGINIPDNIEDTALLKVAASNIHKPNPKVVENLIKAVLIGKNVKEAKEHDNAGIDPISASIQGIGAVAQGAGAIAQAFSSAKVAKIQAGEEPEKTQQALYGTLAAMENAKAGQTSAILAARQQSGGGVSTTVIVVALFGVAAVVGLVYILKNNSTGTPAA